MVRTDLFEIDPLAPSDPLIQLFSGQDNRLQYPWFEYSRLKVDLLHSLYKWTTFN